MADQNEKRLKQVQVKMENDKINVCLLCGTPSELKHNNFPGYQAPNTFQIFHCSNCNTAFATPQADTSSIYETIYTNADKIPGYDRYYTYAKEIKNHQGPLEYLSNSEEVYWGINQAIRQSVNDKAGTNILEIGCGLGYLTYALQEAGYNTLGLDVSQTAVNQAIKNFGNHYLCADLFDYVISHIACYDIVIMAEVIEHVQNPYKFILAIHQLLKPGGFAIITTPNKTFYYNNILWSTELPPIHLWWLSESSVTHLANLTGMQINFINFTAYYKTHYCALDMNSISQSPLPQPILNQNGELIEKTILPATQSNSPFRTLLSKIPLLTRTYRSLKHLFNNDLAICGKRGPILCAVLQKQ